MDFKAVNRDKIFGLGTDRKYGKLVALVRAFNESETDAAEITWKTDYKSAKNAYTSIYGCVRRNNFKVKVILRGDSLFLVKEEN